MSKKYSELRFEEWIELSLLKKGYHHSFTHSNEQSHLYDRELCSIGNEVIEFIKSTQKSEYDKLHSQMDELTDKQILTTIDKFIKERGIIETLRNGIQTKGCKFELVYFQPKSTLNPEHQHLYSLNRFVVVRQLHYSTRNNNSIDMVIFLNGIPILTMELKNQMSGQNITNSQFQYQSREEKEPIFTFKRVLVHFCVDNDSVTMTTHLRGTKTKFLPYNRDIYNPNVEGDYKVNYLWNEILSPNSLLDIIDNFVLISKETELEWDGKKVVPKTNELLIFPRYHQLDLIRNLKTTIRTEGVGNNYLIQHTTGSGKSYSIGWLSHMLVSLYQKEGDTKRMFDTIIVVTDRKVLDNQLQQSVSKLGQVMGVVNPVDETSKQLIEFLEKGKDIIITTVQKFSVITDKISQLKSKTYGVIIDEVHSSHSGERNKHLKGTLSVKESVVEEGDETYGEVVEEDYEDMIEREIRSRGKQSHISFFGFTGTPKPKTLELFGRKDGSGFVPFHTYSMLQSIHEGFTLDVLNNYTTYKRYFKIIHKGEDKELPESKVKRELVNFADSHPETIRQKVTIILEHFIRNTSKTINGKGRGMVVVRSRKHCVLFFEEMSKQMKEMGLPYRCLVGFSGTIFHNGIENTESSLNKKVGMEGEDIPMGFKDPKFRILIVSNKFQTGYDEPLLQSMYVDKKLGGVQCVQTLSRLNRTTKGKDRTFVLDFVNETEEIFNSFQPYFTYTTLTEETEPDMLYGLVHEIEQYNLYTKQQLDDFCKLYFDKRTKHDNEEQFILNEVVERYREKLNEEEKETYKSKIQSFCRLYSYISQISSFGEIHWEKTYVFLMNLNKKLPKRDNDRLSLIDTVDLDSLRIQMIGTTQIGMVNEVGKVEPISGEGGGGKNMEEEKEYLSEIVKLINSVYGTEIKEDNKLTLTMIEDSLIQNQQLNKILKGNNSEGSKKDYFRDEVISCVSDVYSEKYELYNMLMSEKILPQLVSMLYEKVNRENGRFTK